MSAGLKERASWEASFSGIFWKQVFHRVPKIPLHIDLHDKVAVVTGSSSGLGLECARQLLQLRLKHLILAVRSQSKGHSAISVLQLEFPKAHIEVWILDMESYESVQDFAARCETLDRLDVVILNAGCGKMHFSRCGGDNGREVTLQVNYLATILLTILLIPILKVKAAAVERPERTSRCPGRLTIVGSDMAFWVKIGECSENMFDAMNSPQAYDGMKQYSKTKLLLPMFVSKLVEVVSADAASSTSLTLAE
jgi:NAD(P)-dependent dehydrogenase (short-subunit alcohol dehydrogenase family)